MLIVITIIQQQKQILISYSIWKRALHGLLLLCKERVDLNE
nr:MAG TPA: hypothetical protein [Caudoviricetes sp.]